VKKPVTNADRNRAWYRRQQIEKAGIWIGHRLGFFANIWEEVRILWRGIVTGFRNRK
jgi:hypothetical protein